LSQVFEEWTDETNSPSSGYDDVLENLGQLQEHWKSDKAEFKTAVTQSRKRLDDFHRNRVQQMTSISSDLADQ
jgi:hypothetical protein